MKKSTRIGSVALIVAVFFILAALSVWFGVFAVSGAENGVNDFSRADDETTYESLTLDLTSWTPTTYRNAPDFDTSAVVSLTGSDFDCIGYSLPATASEQYSMDAFLCSPKLNVAANSYIFRFSYYTCIRESTPHKLTLLSSDDGVDFSVADAYECVATGEEFKTVDLSVSGSFSYLKLQLTVYYSKNDETDSIDRGLFFLRSGFSLLTEKHDPLDQSYFRITYSGTFIYNGTVQAPEVTVYSNIYQEKTDYTFLTETYRKEAPTSPCESINAGEYILKVFVRNSSNTVCFVDQKEFTIEKAPLTVRKIEYICNDSYVVVLHADMADGTGRIVSETEAGLDYYTSTVYGDRVESHSPVIAKPTESFSVGVVVRSENFVPPVENTFVTVRNALTSNNLYLIPKRASYVYDGYVVDPLEDVFFSSFGTPEAPTATPAISYFLLNADEETQVSEIKNVGDYRCELIYGDTEYGFFVTVTPRPVVAYLYSGGDLTKYYDGTDVLFDQETDAVVTQLALSDLSCIEDPDFSEGNGVITNEQITDAVTLQYRNAVFARTVGKTYIVLNDPVLSGTDAANYYIHPSFHVVSAVLLEKNTYEKNGTSFTATGDAYYRSNKEYATATFNEQAVAAGGTISGVFYEKTGETYSLTEDTTFAEGKKYYTLRQEAAVQNNEIAVLPTQLILKSDKDEEGRPIAGTDKVYVPEDLTTPKIDSDVALPCYGNDAYSITYKDVEFLLDDPNVGSHPLSVRLSDMTLLDRYLIDVLTPVTIYGSVVPRPLSVNETAVADFIEGRSKAYDGTDTAHPVFTDLVLSDAPTGFPAFSDYTVSYRTATYAQSDAGSDVDLTISGVTLTGLTASAQAFLSNYSLDNVRTKGDILPKALEIYTKSIRVYERQMPNVRSNAESDADLRKKLYPDETSARNEVSSIPFSATTEGQYVLRVDLLTTNYVLPSPGYVLLPMNVIATEKAKQKIVFPAVDLSSGTDFSILINSVFSIDVHSVDEESRLDTGLSVSCAVEDPYRCLTPSENYWTASRPGVFTMTFTQPGNNYYYAADPVTLTFTVLAKAVTGSATATGLYGGLPLPDLAPDAYRLSYDGGTPVGNLVPSEDILSPGTSNYTYYFTSDPTIGSFIADFSIPFSEKYYVKSGETYEKYAGAYSPYEKYYRPTYRQETVGAGERVPKATYYENAFVVTADTTFRSGKSYYLSSYAADGDITVGDVVPNDVYFEMEAGRFFRTRDVLFMADKTYYLPSYQVASVTAGEAVDGVYYEHGSDYFVTEDSVFDGEKTYYILTYEPASVENGHEIPTNVVYYERTPDVYTLTTDTAFLSGKTYYKIVYSLADVAADTAISGVYYEIDRAVFILTHDILFSADKNYYSIVYAPVYFISAGDPIDVDLYREKGENNSLLTITPGESFGVGKSYALATWSVSSPVVGDPVPADVYYEKDPTVYREVSENYFFAGKTYYIRQYSLLSFSAGDPVAEETYEYASYYGVFLRTADAVYQNGKKYYSPSYVVALSPDGEPMNGDVYYEKAEATYSFTTDEYFLSGKTYYTRSFEDVKFLVDGDLPEEEFYRSVPRYALTSDTSFMRDTIYYTVSYHREAVTSGDHVVGEYYEASGNSRVLTSDRYFAHNKEYYTAVFTAQNTLKKRLVDHYNTYYTAAQGLYAAGTTYYRFENGAFASIDLSPDLVGTAIERGVYLLVTDPEFEQGKAYYHLAYPFLGQAKVNLSLTAAKPTVTVYTVANSSSLYGEEPNLYDFIEKVTVYDGVERTLSYDEWENGLDLTGIVSFEILTASADNEIGAFEFSELAPGTYAFENNQRDSYSEETVFLKMTADESDVYTFVLASGSTVHTVAKNNITVRMPEQSKYYGESIPTDQTLTNRLSFEGASEEIAAVLKENYTLSVQAYSYSDCGEYPIRIQPKQMLSVGSPVAANTYYEKTDEDVYFLTSDDRFAANKTYYVLVYKEEEVTVGDPIDISRYYILYNNVYIRPSEDAFLEGTTYYVQDHREVELYRGVTIVDLEQNYDITLIHGFLTVTPIPVTVGASSVGHDYGDNVAEIETEIGVTAAHLTDEELEQLKSEVLGDVVAYCEGVSYASDSGDYPITIVYNGANKNVIVTTRRDCYYPVHYAKLSPQSFIFNDTTVLYDGMLHTITVSYNANLWQDVTITYDKGSFSEIGNYLYTATVSKKNYEDLVLQATMSIGTLTVRSSNQVSNAVTVVITDPTCYTGINGDYSIVLRPVSDEDKINDITALIDNVETSAHSLKKVYSVVTYLDSSETSLGYSSYTVTIVPTGLKYQSNLALYGYSRGQFRKLDYTYQNGAYTFTVSSNVEDTTVDPLSYFAFAELTETQAEGVQYKWIFIAIIGAAILLVLGIVLGALFGAGKKRGRSRRRHNRWV